MTNQIIVPSFGESVTEATVSKWLKQVGEQVDSDEPLVELETDKVNVEVTLHMKINKKKWKALLKPGRKCKINDTIIFQNNLK